MDMMKRTDTDCYPECVKGMETGSKIYLLSGTFGFYKLVVEHVV